MKGPNGTKSVWEPTSLQNICITGNILKISTWYFLNLKKKKKFRKITLGYQELFKGVQCIVGLVFNISNSGFARQWHYNT